jgi:hypothetical protein
MDSAPQRRTVTGRASAVYGGPGLGWVCDCPGGRTWRRGAADPPFPAERHEKDH